MSIFDRLNRRLIVRLRPDHPRFVAEDDAISVLNSTDGKLRLPFSTLTRATLLHRDIYSADAILLRLTFRDGERIEIFQDDPRWEEIVAALDRSGRIGIPSKSWQLQSVADGSHAPPRELIDRDQDGIKDQGRLSKRETARAIGQTRRLPKRIAPKK